MERGEVVAALAGEGRFLDEEALDFIMQQKEPFAFAKDAIGRMPCNPMFVTMKDLRMVAMIDRPRAVPARNKRHDDIEFIDDVTGQSECQGTVEGFRAYFLDRFLTIKGMLLRRRDMATAGSIRTVTSGERFLTEKEVRVIGIVSNVKEMRGGDRLVDLEDETGRCSALIPKNGKAGAEAIIPDEVVGIVAKPSGRGGRLYATGIVRPDVPFSGGMEASDSSSVIGFMGDVHVGSNTFLKREWKQMTAWLRENALDMGINYIHIPGDLVDGIGVFPDQEDELEIDDIFDQYKALAEHLKEIPDHITLLVQPGNHDYVRPAEPQPAFDSGIAKLFDSNVRMLGNPSSLRIEGRLITSYHGKSFDDMVKNIKGSKYQDPIGLMKEMLKRRHLATYYGGRTPLAPEKRDYLVIRDVPDIFVTGHVHGAEISHYNGVRLINASTWQDQTSFQKRHNFVPQPARLALVHLGNGRMRHISFDTIRERAEAAPGPPQIILDTEESPI
jgi:DNA polymerase II small subunit